MNIQELATAVLEELPIIIVSLIILILEWFVSGRNFSTENATP